MPLHLRNVPLGKKARRVHFAQDDGVVSHADGPAGSVFALDLNYLGPRELADIMADSYTRGVMDAKRRQKGKKFDGIKSRVEICRAAVSGWSMTVGGARALRIRLDLSRQKLAEEIPFDPDNLDHLAEHSDLGEVVNQCMLDYEFWFPATEGQEKNSPSGPGGSTAASPAAPASTPT